MKRETRIRKNKKRRDLIRAQCPSTVGYDRLSLISVGNKPLCI